MVLPLYSRTVLRKSDGIIRNKAWRSKRNMGVGSNVKNVKKNMVDGERKQGIEAGRLSGERADGETP